MFKLANPALMVRLANLTAPPLLRATVVLSTVANLKLAPAAVAIQSPTAPAGTPMLRAQAHPAGADRETVRF
jgi:hypothetical protein